MAWMLRWGVRGKMDASRDFCHFTCTWAMYLALLKGKDRKSCSSVLLLGPFGTNSFIPATHR